jgi:hypothetical protein
MTIFAVLHVGEVNALNDDILAKLWIYLQTKLVCHSYSDTAFTVLFCCIGVAVWYYQTAHSDICAHLGSRNLCILWSLLSSSIFLSFSLFCDLIILVL